MYYKDDHIEIRLGAGVVNITSPSATLQNLKLYKIVPDEPDTLIDGLLSENPLTAVPDDGSYRFQITAFSVPPYDVYFTVNDNYIKEFLKQLEAVVCNCGCTSVDIGCNDNKKAMFALKRQRLFNLTSLMNYTIKPFNYGQTAVANPYLFKFFQLYFNEALDEKRVELGKEYFDYYVRGSNEINVKLFNELIAIHYYALYYYSKKFLTMNAGLETANYIKKVNTFFNLKAIEKCLGCSVIKADIEAIMDAVFLDPCFCTSDEPTPVDPPLPIVARNVQYVVPYTEVLPNTVFDAVIPINTLLDLTIPSGVATKFLTVTGITDSLGTVKQGLNLVSNLITLVNTLPMTSLPIKGMHIILNEEVLNYNAVLTCFVTDNYGNVSNSFTITLKYVFNGKPIDTPFVIIFRASVFNVQVATYPNIFAITESIPEGYTIGTTTWTFLNVYPTNGPGSPGLLPLDPNYAFFFDFNMSNYIVNGTPGYTYEIQVVAITDTVPPLSSTDTCIVNFVENPVIHPTYEPPTLVLTLTQAGNEVGSALSGSYIFTQKDAGGITASGFKKNGVEVATTPTYTAPNGVENGNNNYQAFVTYANGVIKNNNNNVPDPVGRILAGTINSNVVGTVGQYPIFYGGIDTLQLPANVNLGLLTKIFKPVDSEIDLSVNIDDKFLVVAVPAFWAVKTRWFVSQFNQGDIGGASNFIGDAVTANKNSPTALWNGVLYRFYISNYATIVENITLKNN